MTTDVETTQRIRSLLEPRGYSGYWIRDGNLLKDVTAPDGSRWVGWKSALRHFLKDKPQTGARIADIIRVQEASGHEPNFQVFNGCTEDCYCDRQPFKVGSLRWNDELEDTEVVWGYGNSVDEAVADLWLKANGLEDPRKVTA